MSKIFISYRRQDSRPVATLIYDPLARHFEAKHGAGAVFMDVHGIPLGVNFRSYLNEQVGNAELLLALIADRWLTSVDEHGARRLDSPNDFVRIEIEAALKRGVPVVPVYVDDAKFLREADLPDGLKELVWMNGFQLRTDARYFAANAARLIADLEPHLQATQPVADDKALAKKYFQSGEEHYNKRKYDRAIADYDQAIRRDPEYAAAFNSRGYTYDSKGEFDRAIDDYDQAIRLNPKYALAYNNRGVAHYSKDDYDSAIDDYDHALAIDPNYQRAAQNRRIAEEKRAEQRKKKGWFG
jgi:tetratricopeptide (TPR) repeat protein